MKKSLFFLLALITLTTQEAYTFQHLNRFNENVVSAFNILKPKNLINFNFMNATGIAASPLFKNISAAKGALFGLGAMTASTYFFNYLKRNNIKTYPEFVTPYTVAPLYFMGFCGVQFGLKAFKSQSTHSISSLLIPGASYLAGAALWGYTLSGLFQRPTAADQKQPNLNKSISSAKSFQKGQLLEEATEKFYRITEDPKLKNSQKINRLADVFWDMGELWRENKINCSQINLTPVKNCTPRFIELAS